ncbi:MAG: ADP-ribosylation factor-like protein [Phototrophicaceae bacterium]|jgi:signal recognition particle receptor subunit beta
MTTTENTQVQIVNIAVLGLYGAGKSTFINTISQRVAQQGEGTALWRYGQVDVDDSLTLQFLEPPSGERFDFIWLRDLIENLDVSGYVVLVDSTKPETFGEFISVLYTIRAQHTDLPILVAANKQNHFRAWSTNDLKVMLRITDDVPIMPCIASDFEVVKNVVLRLMYNIFEG